MAKKKDESKQPVSERSHFAAILLEDFHHRVGILQEGFNALRDELDQLKPMYDRRMSQLEERLAFVEFQLRRLLSSGGER